MVKKFTVNCDFGGQKSPVTFYIGNPAKDSHPLNFQSTWLSKNRGGTIPQEIMNAFGKLVEISERNRVSFEDLCAYVIEELKSKNAIVNEVNQANSLSKKEK